MTQFLANETSSTATCAPDATLLYDGACHLCSREIKYYRRLNTARRIAFVDISAPDFNAALWHVDRTAVNQHMHVRLPDGSYRIGLDAFIAVWTILPGHAWMARVATTPGLAAFLRLGYKMFAKIRPLLPKRANSAASCWISY